MSWRCPITVGEIGEFEAIARILRDRSTEQHPNVLLGPGDDAAVIAASDRCIVASTDLFVAGEHFRQDWCSADDVGHRAAAAAMADVVAMGAKPTAVLLGIGCPADTPMDWLTECAAGFGQEAAGVNAVVAGGDLSQSSVLTLAVTALGELAGREPVTRSGAKSGDIVAYAGRLGWAAAGLAVLTRGFRSPTSVVAAYRRPEVPYTAGRLAAEQQASAMCDVSDGLVADLGHIAQASKVSIDIDTSLFEIPQKLRDVGEALGIDPLHLALTGGDDCALVATFPALLPPEGWHHIGHVGEGSGVLVDGKEYSDGGWQHFSAGQR